MYKNLCVYVYMMYTYKYTCFLLTTMQKIKSNIKNDEKIILNFL